MKKTLLLCALPALFVGCVPKSELEKAQSDLVTAQSKLGTLEHELQTAKQTLPAEYAGTWRCQTTRAGRDLLGGNASYALEATLVLDLKGKGAFTASADGRQTDNVVGTWLKSSDFLVIEGESGFAAFRVPSKADTKMTLLNRQGQLLEFTKIR